jgi:CubicO group peptidase (beta-lactamase class C family)
MKFTAAIFAFVVCSVTVPAQTPAGAEAFDVYLLPYVRSANFSGVVLVERNGKPVFQQAYGLADREKHVPTASTRFT